jgi:hypothetical protein
MLIAAASDTGVPLFTHAFRFMIARSHLSLSPMLTAPSPSYASTTMSAPRLQN